MNNLDFYNINLRKIVQLKKEKIKLNCEGSLLPIKTNVFQLDMRTLPMGHSPRI
jgi:hypothetical protein